MKDFFKLRENVELDENAYDKTHFAKVSKELRDYAKKNGGIDKKDFERTADLIDQLGKYKPTDGAQDRVFRSLRNHVKSQDTDVRDKIMSILKKNGMVHSTGVITRMRESVELDESVKTEDKGQFIYAAKQAKAKGDSTFVFAGKTYNCEEVLENDATYKPDPDGGNHKAVKAAETRAKIAKHDAETRKSMDEAVNMGPWNRGAINKAMGKAGIKGKMAKDFIAALRVSGTVDEK